MQESQIPEEEGVYTNEAMFHDDILYRVPKEQMTKQLHKHIGALTYVNKIFPDQVGKGSGILISCNLVLTAAHNIYSHQNKILHQDIKFYPGQCGPLAKYYEVEDLFFPGKFIWNNKAAINDYALLKLKEKVETDNFIEMSGNMDLITKDSKIAIFGYPDEAYRSQTKDGRQNVEQMGISQPGRILEKREDKIQLKHTLSTKSGHSGAPIILQQTDGKLKIVGIHKGGQPNKANIGRLITDELIKHIQTEAKRMGADLPGKTQSKDLGNIVDIRWKLIEWEILNLEKEKRFPEALILTKYALKLYPDEPWAHNILGLLLHKTNRSEQGKQVLEKAIKKYPEYERMYQFYQYLGYINEGLGNYSEGKRKYLKAIQLNKNAEAAHRRMFQIIFRYEPKKKNEALRYMLRSYEIYACPISNSQLDNVMLQVEELRDLSLNKYCIQVLEYVQKKEPFNKTISFWLNKMNSSIKRKN